MLTMDLKETGHKVAEKMTRTAFDEEDALEGGMCLEKNKRMPVCQ